MDNNRLNICDIVVKYYNNGLSIPEISKKLNISKEQVYFDIRDYCLKIRSYGKNYSKGQFTKVKLDKLFVDFLSAKSVLDVFAGVKSQYRDFVKQVVSNDIDKNTYNDYYMDASKFLAKLYSENKKFDIVDLDPYGSCFECIPLALKIAKKGIIISYGDFNNYRYKRYHIIFCRYNPFIEEKLTSLNLEGFKKLLIKHTKYIAKSYFKKELFIFNEYSPKYNFFRIYYQIKPFKYIIKKGG